MVSKKVVKLLNEQIALEADSSNVYLAMAAWAEANGWKGTSAFMHTQTEEERGHMKKFMHFLLEVGEQPVVAGLKAPENQYKNIKDVFETALKHEKKVTASINNIMSEAREANDYAVTAMLQWFISEQVEEEATMVAILDVIEKAGPVSMYLADKEIGAMRAGK
jgi:ferritin